MKNKELITQIYAEASPFSKIKQRYREIICPFEPIESHLPREKHSMLDVGCGSGWFGIKNTIKKKGVRYVGLDSNPVAIKEAQKAMLNAKNQGLILEETTHEYVECFEQISSSELFDVVVIIDVLHHVKSKGLAKFMLEVKNRLAPGGVIIIKDMNSSPFIMRCVNQLHDLVLAKEWIEHIEINNLVKIMSNHGLSIAHKEEYSCGLYSHYLVVFSYDN